MKISNIYTLTLLLFAACSIQPQEIEYGKDICHFCSMTIVDRQHASEMVTSKGKVYKYDAIECMINDVKSREAGSIGLLLVNDFNNPGEFIDATQANFLVSESLPSPMGAYLSAFALTHAAESTRSEHGGELYDWNQIKKEITKN